jgi:hypothetical protein
MGVSILCFLSEPRLHRGSKEEGNQEKRREEKDPLCQYQMTEWIYAP